MYLIDTKEGMREYNYLFEIIDDCMGGELQKTNILFKDGYLWERITKDTIKMIGNYNCVVDSNGLNIWTNFYPPTIEIRAKKERTENES